MNRVVITGISAITPIGLDDSFFDNLLNHKTNFSYHNDDDNYIVSKIDIDFKNYFKKKQINKTDRYALLGLICADNAIKDSNLIDYEPNTISTYIGSSVGGISTLLEESHSEYEDDCGIKYVSPLLQSKTLLNMLNANINIKYNIMGESLAISTACASSTDAIGQAYESIKYGKNKICITGGSDSCINNLFLGGFKNMNALSSSKDLLSASNPFDKNRSGFVLSEGSAIFVLEDLDHALKRNANIYCEIVSYASNNDAYNLVSLKEDGSRIYDCMKKALDNANLSPLDIDYINAHGTSTLLNDKTESLAISKLFDENVAISSTKANIGHSMGACGAIEIYSTIKSIKHSIIPAMPNLNEVDFPYNLNFIRKNTEKEINFALSNSFGFGGNNACLVLKKY